MPDTHSIDLGGHRLQAAASGSGAAHFTCLHGLVDNASIWRRTLPGLEARGRVLVLDQRGHGASDAPPGPYSRTDLADDVVRALDAEGVERSILVGHSMGGIVAVQAALSHPDRIAGLVLIGSTSECREKVAEWYERIAVAGESQGLGGLRREIYGDSSSKEIVGDAQGISHVTRMLKSLHSDPLTPKLAALACPTLLLVGEKDPMGPKASQIIHDAMPEGTAQLRTLPGLGHWLHVEAPDEVLSALDEWLTDTKL